MTGSTETRPRGPRVRPPLDRFWEKVDQSGECWLWTASLLPTGYAQFNDGTAMKRAHVWIYTQVIGPIPEGLEIDHTCRVRHCVRPDHLEAVTHAENNRRAWEWRKGRAS